MSRHTRRALMRGPTARLTLRELRAMIARRRTPARKGKTPPTPTPEPEGTQP